MGVCALAIWSNSAFWILAQVADVEAEHHLLGNARAQHDARGLRVEPEVEFGGGSGIAGDADVAAHEDDALDLGFDVRLHAQRERDVGHRAERQDGDFAGVAFDLRNQEIDGVMAGLVGAEFAAGRRNDGRGILREGSGVTESAPAAVEFLGHGGGVDQRRIGADGNGDLRPLQQVEDVEHVLGALRSPDVARHDGDALYGDLRGTADEHHQCCAIVAEQTGIGVDDYGVASRAGKAAREQKHRQETRHETSL